jgi:hypothetical protein
MFNPTYLYIKTHNVTGLKYFGKTEANDPYKYQGSGTYWVRHIKKHRYDVTTEILGYFIDEEKCRQTALTFSKDNDIVASKEWANLKEETLDGGWDYVNSSSKNLYGYNGQSGYGLENLIRNTSEYMKSIGSYDEYIQSISESLKEGYKNGRVNPFKDKSHTEQTKSIIGKASSLRESGRGNSQYETMWIYNVSLKLNDKINKTDSIPEGWIKGRIVDWDRKEKGDLQKQLKQQEKECILNEKISVYENYYEIYKTVGFNEFVNITNYDKTKANLVQQFAKYVKSFVPQNGKKRL